MRRLAISMVLASALVVGCAGRPERVTQGTLAELHDARPDVEEATVEQAQARPVVHGKSLSSTHDDAVGNDQADKHGQLPAEIISIGFEHLVDHDDQ